MKKIIKNVAPGSEKIVSLAGKIKKGFLLVSGLIFVGLGVLGIFLPLLPTTVFFLLAAVCFAHSSKKFYDWLLENKWFGSYIKNYREKKGVSMQVKIFSTSLLWLTILSSVIFAVDNIYIRIGLLLVAAGVTIHILTLPTLVKEGISSENKP